MRVDHPLRAIRPLMLRELVMRCIRVSSWLGAIVISGGVLFNDGGLATQLVTYEPIGPVSTPDPQAFMKVQQPASCRDDNAVVSDYNLADGSYIKALQTGYSGTPIILDAATGDVAGHCQTYILGAPSSIEYRSI